MPESAPSHSHWHHRDSNHKLEEVASILAMAHTPAWTLNSENTIAIKLLVVVNVLLLLCFVAVFARLYSRRVTSQKFAISDGAICLALFFTTALAAIQITTSVVGGVGHPTKGLTKEHRYLTIKAYKFGWLLWSAATTCVRVSILHFLYTIFHQSKFTRWGSITLGVGSIMFFIGCLIDFAAICRPFSFYWRSDIKGKCGNLQMGLLLAAIFNLILDFSIIFLPMPALFKLQMRLKKKLGLVFIFSIGAVICATSVVRIFSVKHFGTKKAKLNWSITIFEDAILSSIEPSLGILNACLPFFPALSGTITSSRLWTSSKSMLSSWTTSSTGTGTKKSTNASKTGGSSWPGSTSSENLTARPSGDATKGPGRTGFQRLKDDAYTTSTVEYNPHEAVEMSSLQQPGRPTTTTATGGGAGGGRSMHSGMSNRMEIDVTRRFEVSSDQR